MVEVREWAIGRKRARTGENDKRKRVRERVGERERFSIIYI